MFRFVRFSGSAVTAAIEPRASAAKRRLQPSAKGLVLAALAASALGCGEDVLVVNWELRSLSDAGLFGEADAGSTNAQSLSAEEAREHAREQDKNDGHDDDRRSSEDKASH